MHLQFDRGEVPQPDATRDHGSGGAPRGPSAGIGPGRSLHRWIEDTGRRGRRRRLPGRRGFRRMGPEPAGRRRGRGRRRVTGLRRRGAAQGTGAPSGPARIRRHGGHSRRGIAAQLALQARDARRVVLRRTEHRRGQYLGRVLHPGRGLRRPAPVDAGVVGHDPPLRPVPGCGHQEDDVGVRAVVPTHAGDRPPVQPGRLLVRRPGRDGQSPHEPLPLRTVRAGQQLLHRPGRPLVGQRPRPLRASVPPARRLLHPDHLPQRAGHHRSAPAPVRGGRAADRLVRASPGPPLPPRRRRAVHPDGAQPGDPAPSHRWGPQRRPDVGSAGGRSHRGQGEAAHRRRSSCAPWPPPSRRPPPSASSTSAGAGWARRRRPATD